MLPLSKPCYCWNYKAKSTLAYNLTHFVFNKSIQVICKIQEVSCLSGRGGKERKAEWRSNFLKHHSISYGVQEISITLSQKNFGH